MQATKGKERMRYCLGRVALEINQEPLQNKDCGLSDTTWSLAVRGRGMMITAARCLDMMLELVDGGVSLASLLSFVGACDRAHRRPQRCNGDWRNLEMGAVLTSPNIG